MLDGRDGSSLKEWLKSNKHVRTVTRDRASAYAKAIKEEIPDAKQIADRFHQHQNFLQVIKKCINTSFPQTIRIRTKITNTKLALRSVVKKAYLMWIIN